MQTTQTSWNPRVFIGASTASLNPQIPSPVHRPSTVAIEIEPGIGFGIDGESIVIGDNVREGVTTITGHLDDGTYPQRDYRVTRSGDQTAVDGYYDWQDYQMRRTGGKVDVQCGDADFSATITDGASGPSSTGRFPAQAYTITTQGSQTRVQGYDDSVSATISAQGGTLLIDGAIPERTFEITRTASGFHVKGAYRFQDFDVKRTADGFVIQGLYPQQRYVVKHQA